LYSIRTAHHQGDGVQVTRKIKKKETEEENAGHIIFK
jgi:hypothetical protein